MSSQAGWDSVAGIATKLLDGNLLAIAVAFLITIGVPILLHVIFYRRVASPPSSNFLLLGPSGAGKTAFTSLVGLYYPLGSLLSVDVDFPARSQVIPRLKEITPHPHLPDFDPGDRDPTPNHSDSLEPLSLHQRPVSKGGLEKPDQILRHRYPGPWETPCVAGDLRAAIDVPVERQ